MTKKLSWRLGKLPTPDEVRELVKDKIITQDEAREILFNSETETERDTKSLEAEIKFLRELVERLAKNQTSTIIETIRYIEKPYQIYPWYRPYAVWCGSYNGVTNSVQATATAQYGNQAVLNAMKTAAVTSSAGGLLGGSFSAIKTF